MVAVFYRGLKKEGEWGLATETLSAQRTSRQGLGMRGKEGVENVGAPKFFDKVQRK
ncbi:MAG: hypothetical protein WBL63_00920 [Candidatus Acidiferrum sp.]